MHEARQVPGLELIVHPLLEVTNVAHDAVGLEKLIPR